MASWIRRIRRALLAEGRVPGVVQLCMAAMELNVIQKWGVFYLATQPQHLNGWWEGHHDAPRLGEPGVAKSGPTSFWTKVYNRISGFSCGPLEGFVWLGTALHNDSIALKHPFFLLAIYATQLTNHEYSFQDIFLSESPESL